MTIDIFNNAFKKEYIMETMNNRLTKNRRFFLKTCKTPVIYDKI